LKQQTIQLNEQQGILDLYDKYSGMLLGYIYEIVKDRELAEQYLVSVFKSIPGQYHEIYRAENIWCHLQQLAKNKLSDFLKTIKDCEPYTVIGLNSTQTTLISQMDDEQKNVFCAIYYHGKTTAELAVQLNKPELIIRKTLKEAFAIIRKSREH